MNTITKLLPSDNVQLKYLEDMHGFASKEMTM